MNIHNCPVCGSRPAVRTGSVNRIECAPTDDVFRHKIVFTTGGTMEEVVQRWNEICETGPSIAETEHMPDKRLIAVGRWNNGRWEVTAGQGTLPDNVMEYLRRLAKATRTPEEFEAEFRKDFQPKEAKA